PSRIAAPGERERPEKARLARLRRKHPQPRATEEAGLPRSRHPPPPRNARQPVARRNGGRSTSLTRPRRRPRRRERVRPRDRTRFSFRSFQKKEGDCPPAVPFPHSCAKPAPRRASRCELAVTG